MKVEKRVLTTMNRCYAASHIVVGGEVRLLLATEGEGPCLAWSGPDYAEQHTVWDGPGGTMSIVPVEGTDGEFLAVQKFFKMFQWDEAKIVHVRPVGARGYAVRDLLQLPYIHRFDLLAAQGRRWFLGSTLSTHKDSKEDWSHPGQVWVGEYCDGARLEPTLLKDGLTKNHGYSRLRRVVDGTPREVGLVTGEQGAFEVTPPQRPGDGWQVRQFMDWPISDIAALDIDGDGELEFATIEPFHGPYFRVYKRRGDGFERVFEHPETSDFYHVVVATTLRGRPVFVGGCRRGRQQLFVVQAPRSAPLELEAVVIDEGVGPANVHVLHEAGRDVIVAANREKAEAALYFVT
jgi:hypothetical protein